MIKRKAVIIILGFLIILTSFWWVGHGQAPQKHKTWEYMIFETYYDNPKNQAMLNSLGAEGWEVAGITSRLSDGATTSTSFCLKRDKSNK